MYCEGRRKGNTTNTGAALSDGGHPEAKSIRTLSWRNSGRLKMEKPRLPGHFQESGHQHTGFGKPWKDFQQSGLLQATWKREEEQAGGRRWVRRSLQVLRRWEDSLNQRADSGDEEKDRFHSTEEGPIRHPHRLKLLDGWEEISRLPALATGQHGSVVISKNMGGWQVVS